MKKNISILLILLLPFVLTSCWGNTEINDNAIVGALAVDKNDDGSIKLTVEVLRPKTTDGGGGGGGTQEEKPYYIVSGTGKSFDDAKKMLQTHTPRLLYWANCDYIILGENMSRDGITNFIQYCDRNYDTRLRDKVLVTKGEAADIFSELIYITNDANSAIKEFIQESELESKSYFLSDLNYVTQSLINTGANPVIGQIQLVEPTSTIEKKSDTLTQEYELLYEGAGVFKHDSLIGWLNGNETRGLLWIKSKVVMGTYVFDIPVDNKDVKVTITNLDEDSKITPVIENGKVSFNITINAESTLTEWDSDVNLNDPELIKRIDSKYEDAIKSEVADTIAKAQKDYKTDFCGFESALYKDDYSEWSKIGYRWEDVFPTLNINVKVVANIRRIGITN